jgi:hypothetical protein
MRRIDTLSAGIGTSFRRRTEAVPLSGPAVERHNPRGGRLQIGTADFKSESAADFIPEQVADLLRNPHRDPLAADGLTVGMQVGADARCAIGCAGARVAGDDPYPSGVGRLPS